MTSIIQEKTVFKAAVLQMVSTIDLVSNLQQIEGLMNEITAVDIVVLPENCLLFSAAQFFTLASDDKQIKVIFDFLSNQAKKHQCYLVAGSIPLLSPEPNKVFSTCLVFSPSGEQVARYQKMHLFDVNVADSVGRYRESETIQAGNEVVFFDMQGIKVGLAICYDLRFPELFRKLSEQGCEVFVLPSAFTYHTGNLHWEVLLRARAIENQCFMLAANQGGSHVNTQGQTRETYGHSMIIDAEGKILATLERGEGVCSAELDFKELRKTRKNMPVLNHRRL